MFFKSKSITTYLEQSAAVEMIMGATHDIKILDFSVFFWQLLDNFCWKLLHWTKTWSEANEWANNWWELLDPMIAKLG